MLKKAGLSKGLRGALRYFEAPLKSLNFLKLSSLLKLGMDPLGMDLPLLKLGMDLPRQNSCSLRNTLNDNLIRQGS